MSITSDTYLMQNWAYFLNEERTGRSPLHEIQQTYVQHLKLQTNAFSVDKGVVVSDKVEFVGVESPQLFEYFHLGNK